MFSSLPLVSYYCCILRVLSANYVPLRDSLATTFALQPSPARVAGWVDEGTSTPSAAGTTRLPRETVAKLTKPWRLRPAFWVICDALHRPPADARRDRPSYPDPDLYRHGGRENRLAAGRPHRDRAARSHRALGERADDPGRFRRCRRPADLGFSLCDDDHLGPVRGIGFYRSLRWDDHPKPARGRDLAGFDGRDRRRALGGACHRHLDHCDFAAVDRRSAEPRF